MTRNDADDAERAELRKAIALRIKLLRVTANLSKKTVAQRVKVIPASVRNWENGTHELSAIDALRLADLFGVTIATIYDRTNEQIGPGSDHSDKRPLESRPVTDDDDDADED